MSRVLKLTEMESEKISKTGDELCNSSEDDEGNF